MWCGGNGALQGDKGTVEASWGWPQMLAKEWARRGGPWVATVLEGDCQGARGAVWENHHQCLQLPHGVCSSHASHSDRCPRVSQVSLQLSWGSQLDCGYRVVRAVSPWASSSYGGREGGEGGRVCPGGCLAAACVQARWDP